MKRMGFCPTWVKWIMGCVRTVSYSFILNGEPREQVVPQRGLRQGDAISPYIFLLCPEALSRLISQAKALESIHGVRICDGAPEISHLFFVDDSFIFFKAEFAECHASKTILVEYEQASGQQINFEKSCISFSRNVPRSQQDALTMNLGVQRVDKHERYHGLPTEISYSKTEAFDFLREKMKKKLEGWRDKTLSVVGKEVLLKAVVQSIPTYVMECFEVPKQLCNEIYVVNGAVLVGSCQRE